MGADCTGAASVCSASCETVTAPVSCESDSLITVLNSSPHPRDPRNLPPPQSVGWRAGAPAKTTSFVALSERELNDHRRCETRPSLPPANQATQMSDDEAEQVAQELEVLTLNVTKDSRLPYDKFQFLVPAMALVNKECNDVEVLLVPTVGELSEPFGRRTAADWRPYLSTDDGKINPNFFTVLKGKDESEGHSAYVVLGVEGKESADRQMLFLVPNSVMLSLVNWMRDERGDELDQYPHLANYVGRAAQISPIAEGWTKCADELKQLFCAPKPRSSRRARPTRSARETEPASDEEDDDEGGKTKGALALAIRGNGNDGELFALHQNQVTISAKILEEAMVEKAAHVEKHRYKQLKTDYEELESRVTELETTLTEKDEKIEKYKNQLRQDAVEG